MKHDRAYNREQRERVIRNRKRMVRDTKSPDGVRADGEYAKRHPYDCGRTDCMLCHGHKKNKACASKWKDDHAMMEIEIQKETQEELKHDMCDFGD